MNKRIGAAMAVLSGRDSEGTGRTSRERRIAAGLKVLQEGTAPPAPASHPAAIPPAPAPTTTAAPPRPPMPALKRQGDQVLVRNQEDLAALAAARGQTQDQIRPGSSRTKAPFPFWVKDNH